MNQDSWDGSAPSGSNIPADHPRAASLRVRERMKDAVARGLVHPTGLIAHGRGEAFDLLSRETIGDRGVGIHPGLGVHERDEFFIAEGPVAIERIVVPLDGSELSESIIPPPRKTNGLPLTENQREPA